MDGQGGRARARAGAPWHAIVPEQQVSAVNHVSGDHCDHARTCLHRSGTGSLIIQAAIATAIAVPLFFRHQIGRFLGVVRRRGERQEPAPVDDGARVADPAVPAAADAPATGAGQRDAARSVTRAAPSSRDGRPYRQIQRRFAAEWDAFEASPSRPASSSRVGSSRTSPMPIEPAQAPEAHAVIRPERIEFISYPYESTFGELRDAALLTLDVELDAMRRAGSSRSLRLQRPVPRRPARPHRLALVRAARGGAPWVAYRSSASTSWRRWR